MCWCVGVCVCVFSVGNLFASFCSFSAFCLLSEWPARENISTSDLLQYTCTSGRIHVHHDSNEVVIIRLLNFFYWKVNVKVSNVEKYIHFFVVSSFRFRKAKSWSRIRIRISEFFQFGFWIFSLRILNFFNSDSELEYFNLGLEHWRRNIICGNWGFW